MAKLRYDRIRRPTIYEDISAPGGRPIKADKSPPTGYCARCKERHPLEFLFSHSGKYYLCEYGKGRRNSQEISRSRSIQADASEALARLKSRQSRK